MIDSSVDYKNLPRPTWAEIDIDAILNNINEYKKALGNKVEIIVAAKGNGYGHGMLPIVKAINELDIYGFATGNMYEAIEMRKHGIDKPIQLFAHNFPETADLLVKYDLMPSFVKPGDAKSFADALGKDVALMEKRQNDNRQRVVLFPPAVRFLISRIPARLPRRI